MKQKLCLIQNNYCEDGKPNFSLTQLLEGEEGGSVLVAPINCAWDLPKEGIGKGSNQDSTTSLVSLILNLLSINHL